MTFGAAAPTWRIVPALLGAIFVARFACGAPDGFSWKLAYDRGVELQRAGDLDAALRELRLATVLNPGHVLARSSLARVRQSLGAESLREARQYLDKKQLRPAMPLLRRAAELRLENSTGEEVVRLLRNYGYEPYEGGWRHQEEVTALEKRALRLARNRQRELELPGRFAMHRRARLRVFSDLQGAAIDVRLEALFDRLDKAVAAYRALFLPFDLDDSWDGLDVVLIARIEDYTVETGTSDTVGLFLPSRAASYFCIERARTARELVSRRVLFHEVCHQLDYKLLGMVHPPPWLQEGLALCFEELRPGRDGSHELHGLPGDTLAYLARFCPPGSSRWLGLDGLLETRDLRSLHGTPDLHDFYAQAGAFVSFLLAVPESDDDVPGRRALFYQLVAAARAGGVRTGGSLESFRHVIAEHRWTMRELEENFVKAVSRMAE